MEIYRNDLSYSLAVTNLDNDKFVVAWEDQTLLYGYPKIYCCRCILAQIYNVNGNTIGARLRLYSANPQYVPDVASLGNDKFVAVWQEATIVGEIRNVDGTKSVDEFRINTYKLNDQRYPSIESLNNDKFVVIWERAGQDGSCYGIYGQIYNVDGSKNGEEFQINS